MATATSFAILLAAFILFNPSSGAFVNLSQASLMDSDPPRRELNMARWTFAGSAGIVLGTLLVTLIVASGLGWRTLFAILAIMSVLVVAFAKGNPVGSESNTQEEFGSTIKLGILNALGHLRRLSVLRWLILLEFSDLMLDVLHGYLALYLVDVAGLSTAGAALGVATWIGFGLLGDLLLIPLLSRFRGLIYLRFSAATESLLFIMFLLAPGIWPKLGAVAILGLAHAGWYAILKAQLYASMPGQSGTVMAVGSFTGLIGSLVPFVFGIAASALGLGTAMWLLIIGPIAILAGVPRTASD